MTVVDLGLIYLELWDDVEFGHTWHNSWRGRGSPMTAIIIVKSEMAATCLQAASFVKRGKAMWSSIRFEKKKKIMIQGGLPLENRILRREGRRPGEVSYRGGGVRFRLVFFDLS